jgi:asparagine synthase (glutamine-hydrolysing)
LRSDVNIGTSLSGGLDSSTIVALSSLINAKKYTHKSFTAIFPAFKKSEEYYAGLVAEKYNLQQHLVETNENLLAKHMDELMYYQEEPVTTSSALAQYNIYKAAKQNNVTVLLDGQGADEILGGYFKYYKWYWQQLYRQKILSKTKELQAAKDLGVKDRFLLQNKFAAIFPEFAAAHLQTSKSKQAAKQPYLNEDFAFSNKRNLYYSTPTEFSLNGALYYNTVINGLEELLRYGDRNSMAHAVEIRLPYLNFELVFFFSMASEPLTVNEKVLQAFNGTFQNVQNIKWYKHKNSYEVYFQQNQIRTQVHYNDDGVIMQTIRYYQEQQLPLNILNRVRKQYSSKKIYGVTEVGNETDIVYQIILEDEKSWLIINSDPYANFNQVDKFKNG